SDRGKYQPKLRSTVIALELEAPAGLLGDLFRNREPETGATDLRREKWIENLALVLERNSWSIVRDFEPDEVSLAPDAHLDEVLLTRSVRQGLNRVHEEVQNHLSDLGARAAHPRHFRDVEHELGRREHLTANDS